VAVNFQAPVVEIDVGMDAEIEDGEIVNLALAGREAIFGTHCARLLAGHFAGPAFFAAM